MVLLRDVAEKAGVSVSTASRALTGARRVQDDLVDRVQGAANELGYRPNHAARGLRMARTMSLGVLFFQLENPVALDLIEGLGAGAHEADYSLFVTSARRDPLLYDTLIHRFYERRVDGLILVLPRDAPAALEPFQRAGVPVLALIGRGPGAVSLPVVTVDTTEASTEGFQAVADHGHRMVTIIAEGLLSHQPTARATPIDIAAAAARVGLRRRTVRGAPVIQQVIREEVNADNPSRAFVVPYRYLPEFMDAVALLGMRIPDDVSVISFTDSRVYGGHATASLASIRVDSLELGRRSAEIMSRWIDGDIPPGVTLLRDICSWSPSSSLGPAPS